MDGARIVIDGHCRLAAYHKAKRGTGHKVPVRHFCGTFSEALALAARENSQDKLPLTLAEKTEHAWKLTKFNEGRHCYTLRGIARDTGVSKSTAENMARLLKEYPPGSEGHDPRGMTWAEAKRIGKELPEYNEDWQEKQAQEWAARLREALGAVPNSQPDIFRRAIEVAYPSLAEAWEDERMDWRETMGEERDF